MERAAELRLRLAKGENKSSLAKEFGVDRTTVYRYAFPVRSAQLVSTRSLRWTIPKRYRVMSDLERRWLEGFNTLCIIMRETKLFTIQPWSFVRTYGFFAPISLFCLWEFIRVTAMITFTFS